MSIFRRPEISVVIPTYNRIGPLARTLDSLYSQSLQKDRFEVIVVDDGSTDPTLGTLQALKNKWEDRLIVLQQEHRFSGAARNLGIRSANSDLILSMDDDILADKDLLNHHLRLHRRYPENQTALVGRVITGTDRVDLCDPDDRSISFIKKTVHGDGIVDASAFTTQNTSMKRNFIMECGLFTPGLKRLDDLDLAFRMQEMGMQLIYAENAVGIHTQPLDTLEKVIEMGKRYGQSLAEHYELLPWIEVKMEDLGARFNGGRRQLMSAPAAYVKDALRRLAINRMTIYPLTWAASKIPVTNPPSRSLVRCCREIWAFHYRNEFFSSLSSNRANGIHQRDSL